jgi:predicted dehydrogenase
MQQPKGASSRRNFLASGAAAAGAFTIVNPKAVRGSQANSRIAVGLIGSGSRGTFDASIIHRDPRGRITALCDLYDDQLERAKQKLGLEKVDTFRDYQKLLASNVDAVLIVTPPYKHPEHLAAAVQAKKHIYCEKPAGVDTDGCRKVIEAGRRADKSKTIAFGFQQRYGPVYLEGYKRVNDGSIGTLATARAYWLGGDPWTPLRKQYSDPEVHHIRNWFSYKDYSGDIIIEQDCHNFDVLHWFLGLPTRAVGYGGQKIRTGMDIMDHLTLSFEFPNNIRVNFEANQFMPPGTGKIGEEFTGTKGQIEVSRGRMVHRKPPPDTAETIDSKRDITIDALENFLGRIESNNPENVAERSALSTLIAVLGRTAIYNRREATWKGEFGNIT